MPKIMVEVTDPETLTPKMVTVRTTKPDVAEGDKVTFEVTGTVKAVLPG